MSLFDKIKTLEPEASDDVIFDIIHQFNYFTVKNNNKKIA